MNYLTKVTLLSNLQIIKYAIHNLWNLYEQCAPSSVNNFTHNELDDIDVSNLFTMSLDELYHEYAAKIDELQHSIKAI